MASPETVREALRLGWKVKAEIRIIVTDPETGINYILPSECYYEQPYRWRKKTVQKCRR